MSKKNEIKKEEVKVQNKVTVEDLKEEIMVKNDWFMFYSIGNDEVAQKTGSIIFSRIASAYADRFSEYLLKYGYKMINDFCLKYAKQRREADGK